jgi:hypothetical protein
MIAVAYTLLVHPMNEEPFLAEVEDLPEADDQVLICSSPRRRDGKDVDMFQPEVVTVMLPWSRIHYVELLPSKATEDIVSFIRE